MEYSKIIEQIEDKSIHYNDDWYIHATETDLETINTILKEGIKSAYLRGTTGNHFNGKYYVSLYKNKAKDSGLNIWLSSRPKFIIGDISPYYANPQQFYLRKLFINTRIPLRTSEWDGEYQEYLIIEPSKFIALEYSIAALLQNANQDETLIKERLKFLQGMVECILDTNENLPIYDLSTSQEINKEKVLSLKL